MFRFLLFTPLPVVGLSPAELSLESALPAIRAERKDLNVRPERWDTRSKLATVEGMLADPLAIPRKFEDWTSSVQASTSSSELFLLAAGTLGVSVDTAPVEEAGSLLPEGHGLPDAVGREVERLAGTVEKAQALLERAVESVAEGRRAVLVASMSAILENRDEARLDPRDFDEAARFDVAAVAQATYLLARAADAAIPGLMAAGGGAVGRTRLALPIGDVLVTGAGDDAFAPEDLDKAVLLIKLGGKSRYLGQVAAAREGQIRMVIDLGSDVAIQAAAGPEGAGAGVFGIGLLYLPAEGVKVIQASDVSLGAGLFGAGGLFVRGAGASLTGRRFTTGAAAWGLGICDITGDSATVSGVFAAQGLGFTQGGGVFRLRGNAARLECGLQDPDPREALASIGFCQGTGYGPRAIAAGGVGLALLAGDGSDVRSGYFAQGAGYWHGFGGLAVVGDGNRLQARRYDQGSGVHTAVGALTIKGDHNSTYNWGVGPAYGWDYGTGFFSLAGDENSAYAEWGTGHGDINGNALAVVRGDRNRLVLPDFGSGAFKRNAPSYGIAVIEGKGNRIKGNGPIPSPALRASSPRSAGRGEGEGMGPLWLQFDPWGVRVSSGLVLDPKLKLAKPEWPAIEAPEARREQEEMLQRRLEEAGAKPEPERYAEWLSIASAFGISEGAPRMTLNRLFALAAERAQDLAHLVSSDHFDEYLWLRALLAGLGEAGTNAAAKEVASASGSRRAALIGVLRYGGASAAPALIEALGDGDWRVRREAAAALGWGFGREFGEEPGRLNLLETALQTASLPRPSSREREEGEGGQLAAAIGTVRLGDLLSLLALDPGLRPGDRLALLAKTGGPTDPMGPEALGVFAGILRRSSETYARAIRLEQLACRAVENGVREALRKAAADADPAVAHAALVALGASGDPQDAALLSGALENDSALVREGAAAGLGKLGPAGRERLLAALKSGPPRTRALAAVGLARGSDPGTVKALSAAFAEADEGVRQTAVAAVGAVQPPFHALRARFRKVLQRLAAKDPSPSVRATARQALAIVP